MDLLQQLVHFGMKDGFENIFLTGIIIIKGALGLAQTTGNIAHGRFFEPGFFKKGPGSINDIPYYDLVLLEHFSHSSGRVLLREFTDFPCLLWLMAGES